MKPSSLPILKNLGGVSGIVMPVPMLNIINGGEHADNNVDFQEYMIMPTGFTNFRDSLRASSEVYQTLKKILKSKNYSTSLGDEGGFAPDLSSNEEPIEVIMEAN